jgi:hypothetical protein
VLETSKLLVVSVVIVCMSVPRIYIPAEQRKLPVSPAKREVKVTRDTTGAVVLLFLGTWYDCPILPIMFIFNLTGTLSVWRWSDIMY